MYVERYGGLKLYDWEGCGSSWVHEGRMHLRRKLLKSYMSIIVFKRIFNRSNRLDGVIVARTFGKVVPF